jgi:hypothetical protein
MKCMSAWVFDQPRAMEGRRGRNRRLFTQFRASGLVTEACDKSFHAPTLELPECSILLHTKISVLPDLPSTHYLLFPAQEMRPPSRLLNYALASPFVSS